MAGVIEPVTSGFDVYLNVIRGYPSETFVWNIAEQWKEIEKPISVYYLGDHDPAGLKIEQDLIRRLEDFSDIDVGWQRLAVTTDDFADPGIIGFPVKKNGSKGSWQPHLDRFGDRCVEVDAIPAQVIRTRVQEAIIAHIDKHEWEFLQEQEKREKTNIVDLCKRIEGGKAA
jgi:hypothetical protein